jgi:hypothetical protein
MRLGDIIPNETLRRLNPDLFGQAAEKPAAVGSPAGGSDREADLHETIMDECRTMGWIVLHGSMAGRTGRTLGEPDFVILAREGRVLLIECKTRTGKLSPAQQALKFHAETLGHTVHVVRSLREFHELLCT